jgi:pimeloyl-ACP methyl ester carboxylesterase
MFGGNGATALDWVSLLEGAEFPDGHVFVLVDYPGYGSCEGEPNPQSIYDSTSDLYKKLGERWGLEERELSERSGVIGHSLGAAVALHTAARYGMKKAVVISPFTTMSEMAERRVGKLHFLLRHPFDNRQSVRKLVGQSPPAELYIFHGSRDLSIPISMGAELAELAGKNARFHSIKNRGHNDIVYAIRDELIGLTIQKD